MLVPASPLSSVITLNESPDSTGGLLSVCHLRSLPNSGKVMPACESRLWLLGECLGNEGPDEGRRFQGLSQDGKVEKRSWFEGKKDDLSLGIPSLRGVTRL